ncbi:hypothetical protein HPB51_000554 [Rhipicephalus microplus]|uniref:RING-type domain-containing protein n=1 Tax=Rhipicephalus microplus TaxID=6941 RepID=A0A9J6E590_RHIMP|nr:hypothetical protein HPB51_000554 [Rhipicephalus microplus]
MATARHWYTLVGFSDELDWRQLAFVEPIPPNRICKACGLVTRVTAFLPCLHVFCRNCYEQCRHDDQHSCPLDGQLTVEEDVEWIEFPVENLLKRKAEMECQEGVASDGVTHQDNEETGGTPGGKEGDDDGGWQTVFTVRQKKALAKARKKLTITERDYDFLSPTSKSLSQPTSQKRPQKRKLSPLSKEDFKIIDAWSGRELDPAAGEQGGGDGVRGDPSNIPP